ncbi:MAG: D-Ala-D-Ala carboxypeptidase family metallohydrolase [Sphingomicrobium sp.]
MRRILISLAFIAAPVTAQTTAPAPLPPPAAASAPAAWDPAAPYITNGQDEPGYRSWYLAAPWRSAQVKSFNDYLTTYEVSGIVPTWQLLRTATAWKDCGGQPFEVPPTTEWPHIVQTLRYIHDYVIPEVGPVEPVSGYRNPALNQCAGGAPESAHMHYSAIDMVPLRPLTREAMMRTLCMGHSEHGAAYGAGLGFYAYLRFHVDSTKFRRWNMDPAVAAECPPIIHPEDIATVGQPATIVAPGTATVPPGTVSAPIAAAPSVPASTPPTAQPLSQQH